LEYKLHKLFDFSGDSAISSDAAAMQTQNAG
jgi:hypothetical protein